MVARSGRGREDKWDTSQNRSVGEARSGGTPPTNRSGYKDADGDSKWIDMARDAYTGSTDWVDANVRNTWMRNWRTFNNRHQSGSKYASDEYKHRSKVFRPRTRSMVRKSEAACASAFFATSDVVNISPTNSDDPEQVAAARLKQALLNLRLDQKPVRWFQTLMGAFQSCEVNGLCCSVQEWIYDEVETGEMIPVMDENGYQMLDEDGRPLFEREKEVIADYPSITGHPIENIRFDPGANWMFPVESSPFFIILVPMFVVDVKQRMKKIDPKTGIPKYRKVDDADLARANDQDYNSTRRAREQERTDTKENAYKRVEGHEIVWVHRNFMRREDGQEYYYETAGTETLLTDPKPVQEVFPYCKPRERPIVIGYSNIEVDKTYPASSVEMVEQLQFAINELTNQRIDVGRLALNPRAKVQNGRGVDIAAIRRSVPGAPISMNNMDAVEFVKTPDPNRWSLEEPMIMGQEADELWGSFSQSTVQQSRKLNETVGGMEMISNAAGQIGDYKIRIFAETWVELVLRQVVRMQAFYETDLALISQAGEKARLWEEFGIDEITDEMLMRDFTMKVDVGIGSTDPGQRLQRFMTGVESITTMFPEKAPMSAKFPEFVKEIMGILGYRDGDRFYDLGQQEDPRIEEMMAAIEQLQAELQVEKEGNEAMLQAKQMDNERALSIQGMKSQSDMAKLQESQSTTLQATQMETQGELQRTKAMNSLAIMRDLMEMEHEMEMAGVTQEDQMQQIAAQNRGKLEQQALANKKPQSSGAGA